jgi:hypothetical protein
MREVTKKNSGRKQQNESGKRCIMRCFTRFLFFIYSCDYIKATMHAGNVGLGRQQINTQFKWENLKESLTEDLGVNYRIILEWSS